MTVFERKGGKESEMVEKVEVGYKLDKGLHLSG